MTIVTRAIVGLVAIIGSACQLRLEEPAAPDMTPLEETYDNPPGLMAQSNLALVKNSFQQRLELLRATGNFEGVEGILDNASRNEDVVSKTDEVDEGVDSKLLAVANVSHVCRGPQGDDVIDAGRFGTIKMTLKGGLKGIFPIAWGEFDACSDHTPAGPFTVDGPYSIAVRKVAEGRDVLFLFSGTITSANLNFNGSLTMRKRASIAPEVLVDGAGGNVVLSVDPSSGQILARDRTGLWVCDPTMFQCVHQTTGEVVPR